MTTYTQQVSISIFDPSSSKNSTLFFYKPMEGEVKLLDLTFREVLFWDRVSILGQNHSDILTLHLKLIQN